MRSSISDLPQEALDWRPLPDASSIAVLAIHGITATRFFLRAGSGFEVSLADYRKSQRAPAFETKDVEKSVLLAALTDFEAEAEKILSNGTDAHLAADIVLTANDGLPVPVRNGAGTLFAALGHLREHVGHAQMLHDLWLARAN